MCREKYSNRLRLIGRIRNSIRCRRPPVQATKKFLEIFELVLLLTKRKRQQGWRQLQIIHTAGENGQDEEPTG
ncbi:MAG TPA: hypothetical protein VGD22_19415 [Sphingobacteriaceae bacterium]